VERWPASLQTTGEQRFLESSEYASLVSLSGDHVIFTSVELSHPLSVCDAGTSQSHLSRDGVWSNGS
ncbi:MAG: hypothetical protein ACK6CE_16535, partial [Planctomycetota bacterium]